MPPVKELHYLAQLSMVQRAAHPRCRDERDLRFLERLKNLSAQPTIDLENYGRLFEPKESLLSGDISPNYSTLSNEVIRRVVGYFPNLKVIFLARDPVERVWSHLSMEVRYRQIEPFDASDIDQVNRNLLRRGMLLRSYQHPSTEQIPIDLVDIARVERLNLAVTHFHGQVRPHALNRITRQKDHL